MKKSRMKLQKVKNALVNQNGLIWSKWWLPLLACSVTATFLLLICTKSSFLYPLNDWVDANIYFTMGKGMMNGRVLYRDIFDHKGPLLYFIHGIASLISFRSFLGVYFIEILSFTFFLVAAWKIISLYGGDRISLLLIPVLGAVILSSDSFCHGDSAEELCLPFLMWSLYISLRYFKQDYPEPMGYGTLFLNGILAGCVMWIKYTMLGFHFAWMMMVFFSCVFRKDWKRSIVSCFVFLGGMFCTALPWLIYFGLNGAIGDLWEVYFYDNIFVYAGEQTGIYAMIKSASKNLIDAMISNLKFSIFIVAGFLWFFLSKKQSKMEKLNMISLVGFLVAGICWGVVQWQPYYALPLSIFAVMGFASVSNYIFSRTDKTSRQFQINNEIKMNEKTLTFVGSNMTERSYICTYGAILIICIFFCYMTGNYTDQIGKSLKDTVQYQFADIITETDSPTILNYGFMDSGFYTVCGIVPDFKYFTRTNIPVAELYEEQENIVNTGAVDYVITRGFELSEDKNMYTEVFQMTDEYEGIEYTYYLYQKIR